MNKINKNTDFVFTPNEIYVGSWDKNCSRCIFKPSTIYLDRYCEFIDSENKYRIQNSGCCTGINMSFRLANQEEKQW